MKKLTLILFFSLNAIFAASAMNPKKKENTFVQIFLQELRAEKYDDLSDTVFQTHKELIQENIPNLHKYTRLLHLYCNNGKLSAYFAAESDKRIVIGMDYSEELIEQAQKTYPELSENLKFQKTDIDDPAFSQKFQLAFSTSGLQGALNCQTILRSVYNSLIPGGIVFIATPSKDTQGLIMQTVWQVLGAKHWQPYEEILSTMLKSSFTQETLEKKLKKANFININIETKKATIKKKSLTRYIGRLLSELALSEELQTQLTTEIVQKYFKKTLKIKDRTLVDQIPIYIVKAYKERIILPNSNTNQPSFC